MDEQIKKAQEILHSVRTRLENDKDFAALDPYERLSRVQQENMTFAREHPIVLRYMVMLGLYKTKAFAKYLRKMQTHVPQCIEDSHARYADYVKYLYMETHPHYNVADANEAWKNTFDKLQAEYKDFRDKYEKIKTKIDKENDQLDAERRKELKEELLRQLDSKE